MGYNSCKIPSKIPVLLITKYQPVGGHHGMGDGGLVVLYSWWCSARVCVCCLCAQGTCTQFPKTEAGSGPAHKGRVEGGRRGAGVPGHQHVLMCVFVGVGGAWCVSHTYARIYLPVLLLASARF